ncbi:exo-alpha-sialidase [Anaeromassilibacillus senegalensis]|uniref:exo-alpha-sialidase n=1 Tax=Anaeromassilibacillus senegalensis TaxID=1673717 RepID=A0ABS9CNG7_9FIRM|nr:exo-alpha-sialidase [Anaeromassilibacillus senegalensis]MCF2652503.1 exo-alpha-sialidase [Anaeromassilibacillus senegalensis]
MKKVKKVLSFLLVFCMILTIMPMGVYATDLEESSAAADDLISEATPTPVPAEDIPADDPVEEDPTPAPTEQPTPAPAEEPAEYGVMATSITMGTKPADGKTTNQPFSSGTGSSTNFRIPALVTLSDGTLVAACDARWNHSSDGFGLDTIVSYSTDKGANWNYTFANYLGDNGNVYNSDSTAFIDPALVVTSNDTVYMLVDLYPHGTYIGNVKAGTGFDTEGHLLLRNNSGSSYGYYVGDFVNGSANIYQTNGTQVAGYTVDEYYNITGNSVNTNLFFSDSPYQVLGTSYLYLTKSTDGGKTWSVPQMLNSQVKNSGDMFYGVGPGRGLVTSTGRIMFPCYTYTTQDGNTSVIYSDDNGETWTRSASTANQTSEAALVEADGRIYMFTRHGGYYVSTDNGATWGSKQSVNGISYNTSCQISAITYSKKIDGKTAILLSAPGSTGSRANGKIFVGLVQDDGSISWKYTYSVTNGAYAYSCLTELNDGSIGLLYESDSAAITYTNLAIGTIANGAEIGTAATVTDESTDVSVTAVGVTSITATKTENSEPYSGYTASVTYSITLNGGEYTGAADIKIPYDASIFAGCNEFIGSVGSDTFSVTLKDGYFVGTVPHFSDVTISGRAADTPATKTKEILLYVGQSKTEKDETGNYESIYTGDGLDTEIATVTVKGDDGSASSVEHTQASVTCNTLISSDSDDWVAASGYYYTPDGTNYYPVYAKRSWSWIRWKYTYTWGYSTTSSTSDVTQIGTQRTDDTSDAPNITVYTQTQTDAVPASTTITFTGVTAGTTSVVVGNTRYNITVKDMPPYVNTETTPFVANTGVGDGKAVTKLTTSVGLTFDLDLNKTGSNIKWSVADSSIAKVDQNGKVTGVKAGETTVTATIDGIAYTIPVVIRQDATSSNTKLYDFYLSEITNTSVYMSISCSTDLIEVQDGEAIYISFDSDADTAVDFFGTPNEGYALTRMSSTNSAGDYMALNSSDPKQTDFYTKDGAAGKNQRDTFGDTAVADMVQAALDKDCDGGMGWTRPSSNTKSVTSDLTFRSEKLPTVTKEVATVNGVPYTEGMVAHVGEKVVFTVTVTQYAAQDDITYSNVSLTDNLSGAVFAGSSSSRKTITELSNTAVSNDTTHTYQVEYTITDADLDKTIVNTVDLTYTYKSAYSSGSFGGTANADAKFTAASFNPEDIVIDFGLPVTIDYSGANAHGRYNLVSGVANYGDVTVSNNKVTYTPTETLKDIDTVTLTNTEGGTYTFKVYPATTVYYEEGFATFEGFSGGSKGTGTQTASTVGSKALYGFDSKYANEPVGPSNDTEAKCEKGSTGQTATFEFTGTGVEIYTNNTPNSGSVMASIYDATTGAHVKTYIVHTAMKNGSSNATDGQEVNAYNVPIISARDLTYGQYKVVIKHVKSSASDTTIAPVSIDGFRVHGTLASDTQAYFDDLEDNPTFIELRNTVLAGVGVENVKDSMYADQIASDVMNQVYDQSETTNGAVVLDSNGFATADVKDLLDNGPKNELYLQSNQAVVFKVTTNRVVQIGLKARNANTTYTINNGNQQSLNTSTDMFYTVVNAGAATNGQTITITNTGTGILSITLVKICDDPNAAFASLTEEDLIPALLSLGFEDKATSTPEPTAEPTIEPTATPEPTAEPTPVVTPTPAPTNPPKPVVPNNPIQDFFNTVRNILNKWFGW